MAVAEKVDQSRGGTEEIDAPQSLLGRSLDGKYELEEVLGVGGMGIIFRARQISVDRPVAVKILKPTRSDDVALVQRFRREAELLAEFSHPSIVTLVDRGRDAGGLIYVVMEYVKGATLRQMLKAETLTFGDLLQIFCHTSGALAEIHDRGIVHRDVQLDNIMLSRRADDRLQVTLLDFGVAKPFSAAQHWDLTTDADVAGTPGVMAPEVVDASPPMPESDLYSLGVLLYVALAGERPFEPAEDLEALRAHKFRQIPPLE
ncbi:MAG: serine/threonine-protein kinase, partial [Bradymonadaceae bacterium]